MWSRTLLILLSISLLAAAGGCSKSEQPADKKEQPAAAAATPVVDPLQAQARARAEAEARLAKLLERVVAVFDGYQAFSGHYPQQLEDLNQGGYFFDLSYLSDIVTPPYKAYILLGSDQPYRVWLVDASNQLALEQVAGAPPRPLAAAAVSGLEKEYQARSPAAGLIALIPRRAGKGGAG